MGKLMLYGAGRACNIIQARGADASSTMATVHSFKDNTGAQRTTLVASSGSNYAGCSINNLNFYKGLTSYASADTEFRITDYSSNNLAELSYVRTEAVNSNGVIYTLAATNTSEQAVTVGSIKFNKNLYFTSSTNGACLICGYFLDTPVTIEPGATKTFAVNIDCWNY